MMKWNMKKELILASASFSRLEPNICGSLRLLCEDDERMGPGAELLQSLG